MCGYKTGISGAKPDLFLDQLRVDVTGTIIVMIGRVWDVSAVSGRAKGKMIHCSARANIAYNFLRLKEGGIYSVKIFAVKPNKEEYRVIKDDSFMLEFDGSTTFKRVYVKADGFVKYPLNLVDFDVIEPADNKYLIYVAGYVSNVEDSQSELRYGETSRRCWLRKKTKQFAFSDKVYLSSTSSTVILDDANIPAIKALKDANSGVELKKHYTPIDLTRPVKGTIDNLLMWAQNQKNNVHSFPTSLVWNIVTPSNALNKLFVFAVRHVSLYYNHRWCQDQDGKEFPLMR
ncbi:hypothetical protein Tco_0659890 [Tanacetum coccineum]